MKENTYKDYKEKVERYEKLEKKMLDCKNRIEILHQFEEISDDEPLWLEISSKGIDLKYIFRPESRKEIIQLLIGLTEDALNEHKSEMEQL